ncbi:hypothetical protein EON68_05005 [archaeon]|nr:MAG: hypothetical protein EON68_05005 [archaeon]
MRARTCARTRALGAHARAARCWLQIERSLADTTAQLQREQYASAERRARESSVAVHTLELTVGDLDKYHHALNAALAQFHLLKIAEVNGIIRDLWRHTYRGSDIEKIEICSDAAEEADGKAGGSFHYRVVMTKGDAALDMRGRCSAGQKVLASIVIRLALAEAFCLSTGMLALDEPTTNLDVPNRMGLASALARLVALRSPGHLQLLLITHDEDFVAGTRTRTPLARIRAGTVNSTLRAALGGMCARARARVRAFVCRFGARHA